MLSRVIRIREAAALEPQPFTPAPLTHISSGSVAWVAQSFTSTGPDSARLARECERLSAEAHSLRANIAELETQLAATRRDAFEAGRRQGEQHAQAELAPVLEQVKQSIADTVNTRSEARRRAESDVV